MLPISWPVSVVLALFMTAIHIVYRIGTSPDYAPNLSMVSPRLFAFSIDQQSHKAPLMRAGHQQLD